MKITVVGAGYVGLSLAVLMSRKYNVCNYDVDREKIKLLQNRKSPIRDALIEEHLEQKNLNLSFTTFAEEAYVDSDFVVVCTPTNYDPKKGNFDTSSVESVIQEAHSISPKSYIIIKSTVPLGFTNKMRVHFKNKNITFSPEFLREGKSLYDNLYPSRIIVGDVKEKAKEFANILLECSENNGNKAKTFFMDSSEAEAVKLFANTYLAMRVSFFNELDSFSETHNLSTKNIINGVSSDPRIGDHYNNPSFGYGGYCLPKDTKQLLSNFNKIPNNIIKAIIDSNETRKNFIFNTIFNKQPSSVGVYRLTMKKDSDNFRESAIFDIVKNLIKHKIKVYLFEPELESSIDGMFLVKDLEEFINKSETIIANRMTGELESVKDKVYTRDIFGEN